MKRPLCIFFCFLLLFLIAKVEWNSRSHISRDRGKIESNVEFNFPLGHVDKSEKAFRSHQLKIESDAAIVLDAKKGEVLFEKNMEQKLPIASLTKLMSALVFLESNPRLDNFTTITTADADCKDNMELNSAETLTFGDLLHACLMGSSNRATRALARASGLPVSEFVERMNRKAKKLGLEKTYFFEPTGLSEKNTATALDCAKLLYFALQDSTIASISEKTSYHFVSLNPGKSVHQMRSINGLLFNSLRVKGCKTGFNGASGWCLGTMVEGDDGMQIVAVVLGAPDKRTRYKDARSIVEWCMKGHKNGG